MRLMVRWSFRLLAVAVMTALPIVALFTGEAKLVPFLAMPLVVLGAPVILRINQAGGSDSEAESEDDDGSDGGGGGNRRPDRGPTTPSGPMGELPLEFSRPGSWRSRGNGRQRTTDPGHRRQPHRPAPTRTPGRTPAGPRRH
jgi:hypothetical protein